MFPMLINVGSNDEVDLERDYNEFKIFGSTKSK